MADGTQLGTAQDDSIDFRPLAKQPAPLSRGNAADDGIDFQPSAASTLRTPTLDQLAQGRIPEAQTGPMGAAAGLPRSLASSLKPPTQFVDTARIPRSPLTNQLELEPPMATVEEARRAGTIGPPPKITRTISGPHGGFTAQISPTAGEGLARAIFPGAPQGSEAERLKIAAGGLTSGELANERRGGLRVFDPSLLMSETERAQHPVLTGAGEFAGGMTSPENLALLGLTAGAGEFVGPGAPVAKRLLAAGFSIPMLISAARQAPEVADAFKRGDRYNAERLLTQMGLTAATAGLAGRGMFEEPEPLFVPRGTVSGPLAMDRATLRAGNRLADFRANEAARLAMGRLAEAERGLEVSRLGRINAPVNLPKLPETTEQPPILRGPVQGPERNPLEAEAARVREERAAKQPDFRVMDLRRVTPADTQEPPYYEIAPAELPTSRRGIELPSAGETVGARERSARMSQLASRTLPKIESSLTQRFAPEVLDAARQELNAAAGLASSFERPGRYFAEYGDQNEYMPSRSTNAAKGIHAGGTWYGVSSARGMIGEMYPWFRDVAEGPETFSRIVQEGKGAAYDRLLERVATHIQNEKETARPVIGEYAPQLRTLAAQVRDVDPDLAESLAALAEGKAVGFRNLREYIEGRIHDAEGAALFSKAVDEAASAAGGPPRAQEPSRLGGEARPAESRGEEATREPAGAIDFEPLPEPQPVNPEEIADITAAQHPRGLSAMRRGEFANARPASELRNVLASRDVERNIEEGLRGNRRDLAGEVREEHRAKLERGEILPGMENAVEEQRAGAARVQGERLGEEANRPLGSIEETAGRMERESPLFRGKGPQGELYSGIHPKAVMESARLLSRAWGERVAQPFINKVLKIGDKYQKAREADPAVAEGLHLLDNAPQYLRSKAAQEVHNVIGNLSRAQERLFTLMADADSRENLRVNHPREYAEAQRDPAIQEALRKYKPLEQELTGLRERMGGANLEQDYLRRVYDRYIAGVNKPSAEGKPPETGQFDRVIRPQKVNPKSREADAEYHYRNGLHELGPAFGTKFVATHLKALRDEVAQEFLSKATLLRVGEEEPRSITYGGQTYFQPDVAREMGKGAKQFGSYDPTEGQKFPVPADGRFLGPKALTDALRDYGGKQTGDGGELRRFFQEQVIGFGFGVPHIANILRRVTQQFPGGAANPKAWAEAWRVAFSKELRERGISGLNDPTFDLLARHGAISTGELANLKDYWGGNLNPANWARQFARVGHKVLFEPGSFGGFGGVDQRARIYVADLMRSERPGLSDTQISRAVNDALGEYNRANWTDRQKLLGRFMLFPGWDFTSLRWVLQHPIRTTAPPALVVLLANQALHRLGQNRPEDQNDIGAVHVGDRAYGVTLLRESMARNLFRPALAYAQAKIRGESDAHAMDEAAHGATAGAGGLLSMLRPDLSGFVALATNRQNFFTGKEIVPKQDWNVPGKILPSRALEDMAASTVRHALPALDRMLDTNQEIDLRSFVGGNVGLPNYRDDAEKRLIRDAAEAERVYQQLQKLAKTNPEQARQFLKDPDNAAYALFYRDFASMTRILNRIDAAKEAVEASKLSAAEKRNRLETIEKARANVLTHADGLNNLLFERRQKAKPAFYSRPQTGLQPTPILGRQPINLWGAQQ